MRRLLGGSRVDLLALIEEARKGYTAAFSQKVTICTVDSPQYGVEFIWKKKQKDPRPLNSIVLMPGLLDSLAEDVQEFLISEDWYARTNTPYHRGYLLHGPPGTGKTSTVLAIAGAFNLPVYYLSLAASFVDDSFMQRAAASIPPRAILLLEDLDCAFGSREEGHEEHDVRLGNVDYGSQRARPPVSLSALLNVIDGISSEPERLIFVTTNHVHRMDPAILRPGRLDVRIAYALASSEQVFAMFLRLYPKENPGIEDLARQFSDAFPSSTFSTSEVQGYIQRHKNDAVAAVQDLPDWIKSELGERQLQSALKQQAQAGNSGVSAFFYTLVRSASGLTASADNVVPKLSADGVQ
ncbi:P-loop containing nucleoside triphosphate hydrolase protein [Mycena galericulata]|nr:P-loop containing nucleoside triphosphate hydrolase protein [Mycena galericulata]